MSTSLAALITCVGTHIGKNQYFYCFLPYFYVFLYYNHTAETLMHSIVASDLYLRYDENQQPHHRFLSNHFKKAKKMLALPPNWS